MIYKLLRDLPGVRIGSLFTEEPDGTYSNQAYDIGGVVCRVAAVEMSDKSWFEPLEDIRTEKIFDCPLPFNNANAGGSWDAWAEKVADALSDLAKEVLALKGKQ